MNPKNEHTNGGGDTSPALLDHLLDRNPNRKNGKRGSFRLRLLLLNRKDMVGRKLRLGLRTGDKEEARARAWIAINALRCAGVQLGNLVYDAQGNRVDLNTVEPPRGECSAPTRRRARREPQEDGQGVFSFWKGLFRARKRA